MSTKEPVTVDVNTRCHVSFFLVLKRANRSSRFINMYVSFGSEVMPEPLGALPWVVQCCLFVCPDSSYILQGLE